MLSSWLVLVVSYIYYKALFAFMSNHMQYRFCLLLFPSANCCYRLLLFVSCKLWNLFIFTLKFFPLSLSLSFVFLYVIFLFCFFIWRTFFLFVLYKKRRWLLSILKLKSKMYAHTKCWLHCIASVYMIINLYINI